MILTQRFIIFIGTSFFDFQYEVFFILLLIYFDLHDNMKLTSYEANFTNKGMVMKTKIKELRIAMDMTQQQLAKLVHVSSRTIISIEKEQYSPSLMLAYRIAEVFGVTVEELCCLKENKELEDRQYEDL